MVQRANTLGDQSSGEHGDRSGKGGSSTPRSNSGHPARNPLLDNNLRTSGRWTVKKPSTGSCQLSGAD